MSYLDNQKKIAALYVAAYNRAPDMEGLEYWTNYLVDAEDPYAAYTEVAERFVAVDLFSEIYNTTESNRVFVESVYQNLFGHAGDEEGIDYWTEQLDTGVSTKGSFLVRFIDAALNYEPGANEDPDLDAEAIAHKNLLENRIDVSLFYVEELGAHTNVTTPGDVNDPAYQRSMEVIADVTADPATVAAAKAQVTEWANAEDPGVEGITRFLTEGADRDVNAPDGFLKGTADNDTFIADIIQTNGLQVNTLGTGDRLDGGLGKDTLDAQVTAGAYAGGFANMAIQARTKNIEKIVLEAVNASAVSAEDNVFGDEVFVNAKDMTDIDYIGSEKSNADLVIQDLTTRTADGALRNTSDMTVGMKYTGNKDSDWKQSDLKVLFDQDYLKTGKIAEAGWNYKILNQDSYDVNTAQPVKDFPLTAIRFDLQMNGGDPVRENLTFTTEEMASIYTQQQLVDALNSKLDARDDLSGLKFQLGAPFTDTNGRQSTSIDLVNTKPEQQTIVAGFVGIDEESADGNIFWRNEEIKQTEEIVPVSINVDLEKVGRAGDGGELVIGSMNKGEDKNTWNPDDVNTVAAGTVSGVEVFEVDVYGDKDKSSSLSGMRSTNNNLREVNVTSVNGNADLIIGNSNTAGTLGTLSGNLNALKDVQKFNAFNFEGDLTLHAALSDEVTEKYLDLKDNQSDPAADNFEFAYTGGKGNDTINVAIDSSNLADAGSTTREDFVLTIDGGKGNDTIIASIWGKDDGATEVLASVGNWYNNSKINANLNVLGGDGDDTVYLNGTGDWKVNLGDGADVIYAGDSGNFYPGKAAAAWVLNAQNQADLDDISSNNPTVTPTGVVNAQLQVSFKGFESANISIADSVGALTNRVISDLEVNQAIKDAINNDDVLSKLLVAEDGPGRTLIVTSLIDDEQSNQFSVSFSTAGITPNQTSITGLNQFDSSSTNVFTAPFTVIDTHADTTTATDVIPSAYTADNVIIGGEGDDVIVLGTGANSNDTVKYEGFGNGTDSIVNFTMGAGLGDFVGKNDPYYTSSTLLNTDFIDLTAYDAKFVDFGNYSGVGGAWDAGDETQGDIGAAVVGENFLRVIDGSTTGTFTVEVWRTLDGNTSDADNIEKLGTVGTLDFGNTTGVGVTGFFDADNFII